MFPVIALDHPAALDAARVGPEAAGLAAARAAGLPVVPGVVLTADWPTHDRPTADRVWRITSHDGERPLVLRPSDVRRRHHPGGPPSETTRNVVHAVDDLLGTAASLRADGRGTAPLLLHPDVSGVWRGELFADSRGGSRSAPLVVARTEGCADEWIAELDHTGRILDRLTASTPPPARLLGRLTRLAARTCLALGMPHDLEWTADADDRVTLVRIRPIVRLRATDPCSDRSRSRGPRRVDAPAGGSATARLQAVERTRGHDRRVA